MQWDVESVWNFSIYVSWLMKKYQDCYQSMMKNYRSFRIIYMRSCLHINNKDLHNTAVKKKRTVTHILSFLGFWYHSTRKNHPHSPNWAISSNSLYFFKYFYFKFDLLSQNNVSARSPFRWQGRKTYVIMRCPFMRKLVKDVDVKRERNVSA